MFDVIELAYLAERGLKYVSSMTILKVISFKGGIIVIS